MTEADLIVALLRGQGIPAWVDAPRSVLNAAPAGSASVMVPLGRLADAQEVLDRRVFLDDPAETPEMRARAQRREERSRIVMSALLLLFGFPVALVSIAIALGGILSSEIQFAGAGLLLLVLSVLSIVAGFYGLKWARRQRDGAALHAPTRADTIDTKFQR